MFSNTYIQSQVHKSCLNTIVFGIGPSREEELARSELESFGSISVSNLVQAEFLSNVLFGDFSDCDKMTSCSDCVLLGSKGNGTQIGFRQGHNYPVTSHC